MVRVTSERLRVINQRTKQRHCNKEQGATSLRAAFVCHLLRLRETRKLAERNKLLLVGSQTASQLWCKQTCQKICLCLLFSGSFSGKLQFSQFQKQLKDLCATTNLWNLLFVGRALFSATPLD